MDNEYLEIKPPNNVILKNYNNWKCKNCGKIHHLILKGPPIICSCNFKDQFELIKLKGDG